MPRIYTRLTLAEKLSRHVNNWGGAGCWEWVGAKLVRGYGHLSHEGKYLLAHRVSYELHNGPIPDGLLVLHSCDNPACVRPDHLWVGTPKQNTEDMHKKGRGATGSKRPNAKKRTHCNKGHEMTPGNIVITGTARRCRICHEETRRAVMKRWRAKNSEQYNALRRERRAERNLITKGSNNGE